MPSPSVALLRTQSDERLAALAASGHERAFEAIVERYRRPLLRHCRRYLPEARAEDALQQALVAAWTALRRGDEVQSLRPWLYRIVHNTALNALRAAGYDYAELREILLPTDPRDGPAELAEHRAVVRRTLAGLAALPERQREALLQIAVEGRTQDEVAADLGLSPGGVRQLVHRARTSLRAAATVAVPLPLANWIATAGGGRADVALRVGELVAGAGAGATLAKAGTVAVLAGGMVGGPAVVDELGGRGQKPERATAAVVDDARREARRDEPAAVEATATPAPPAAPEAPVTAAAPVVPQRSTGGEGGDRARRAPRRDDGEDRDGRRRRAEDRRPSHPGGGDAGRQPDDRGDDDGESRDDGHEGSRPERSGQRDRSRDAARGDDESPAGEDSGDRDDDERPPAAEPEQAEPEPTPAPSWSATDGDGSDEDGSWDAPDLGAEGEDEQHGEFGD